MKREKPVEPAETSSTSLNATSPVPQSQPRRSNEDCRGPSTSASGGLLQIPADARAQAQQQPQQPRNHPHSHQHHHHQHPQRRPQDRGGRAPRGPSHRGGSDAPERASASGHPQLFDPKRHDALSFAKGLSTTSQSDARSSTAGSTAPTSAPSIASSEGRERGKRRQGGSERSGPAAGTSTKSSTSRSGGGRDSANYLVNELKRIYREICALETKLQDDHRKQRASAAEQSATRHQIAAVDHAFWLDLIEQHKRLIDLHYAFLDSALQPGLPPSLRSLPLDYEIPVRVWQTGCHLLIESMRQSLPYPSGASEGQNVTDGDRQTQAALLDHLNDFIYSSYRFYTNLLEAEHLTTFRKAWLESLGDLARYRMLMARLASLAGEDEGESSTGNIRNKASREERRGGTTRSKPTPETFARIDDDDHAHGHDSHDAKRAGPAAVEEASIGSAALGDWDLEEKETWRTTAKEWYAQGLAEMPGTGRLHHHLAVLSRSDELKALHHFCKSLTAAQPYSAARESLLPLFDASHQRRRVEPEASLVDLFVHMHGMMITKVQLDDFDAVLERYEEQLLTKVDALGWEHGIGVSQLMMMASVNLAALMQYGAEGAVLAEVSDASAKKLIAGSAAAASSSPRAQSISPLPAQPAAEDDELPIVLQCAIRLAFCTFTALLPSDEHVQSLDAGLNPYVTMLCTLLFRLAKLPGRNRSSSSDRSDASQAQPSRRLSVLEQAVPWRRLASLSPLICTVPQSSPAKLNSAAPLPEDWCLRGLSWTGRKIFEKDYWRVTTPSIPAGSSIPGVDASSLSSVPTYESEVDVLDSAAPEEAQSHSFVISSPIQGDAADKAAVLRRLRKHRIALALGVLADVVPGFTREEAGEGEANLDSSRRIAIRPPLSDKLERWALEAKEKAEEEEKLNKATRDFGAAVLDESADEMVMGEDEEQDVDDEDDTEEVRALKAKRRELRDMLRQGNASSDAASATGKARAQTRDERPPPLPGYTTLVLDTNLFLTSSSPSVPPASTPAPSLAQSLILSHAYTIIIPLAVLTELDGLSRNTSDASLTNRARTSVQFLESAVRTHSKWLKVQTSRGNYLSDVRVRTEDLSTGVGREGRRTLDEVILSAFTWQLEHWVDRLPLLCPSSPSADLSSGGLADLDTQRAKVVEGKTPKVVLCTLDRGLRLRGRAVLSGSHDGGRGTSTEGAVAGRDEVGRLIELGGGCGNSEEERRE